LGDLLFPLNQRDAHLAHLGDRDVLDRGRSTGEIYLVTLSGDHELRWRRLAFGLRPADLHGERYPGEHDLRQLDRVVTVLLGRNDTR
jgi:hypothetical protein